jgi:hypothetical protein
MDGRGLLAHLEKVKNDIMKLTSNEVGRGGLPGSPRTHI